MECEKKCEISKTANMQKPNYKLMSLQRIFVLISTAVAVVIIVYYTPMPEEYFENCDRECHELDWPMICRVKMVVEVYKTLSKSCGNCTEKGGPDCPTMCISGDGRERGVLSINRELPAPPLYVCQNDILVVDVVHRAPAHALAFHWRGQPQKETPWMDGAPMLTQCPQPAYTTFQYKFRASAAGTHMYHAHSAADAADGLAGALVVRQSIRQDRHSSLYDKDLSEHTIFIAEWGNSMGPLAGIISQNPNAESLLINGKGKTQLTPNAPLSKFYVQSGRRYRFRVAYAGGSKSCPINISIDEHSIKLIALDGHRINPEVVGSVEISKGERFDFVLFASKADGEYNIRVVADKSCQNELEGQGVLVYKKDPKRGLKVGNDLKSDVSNRIFSSVYNKMCEKDEVLCLDEVQSSDEIPDVIVAKVDITLYVPFNYSTKRIAPKRSESLGHTDGHRFTYPASPLLTQSSDVTQEAICTETPGRGDECVHIKNIPLYSTVEIILFDQGGESDHIFHLHGYSFYVVGIREFESSLDKNTTMQMHEEGTLFPSVNLKNPVQKDTITVPKFGAVALRFKADNPGYWLMRDERSSHWTRGLDFVIKVGEEGDFVQAPADFPKCGSYVGPDYFLI